MVLWSRTTVVVEKTLSGYTAFIQGEEGRYKVGGITDYEAVGRLVGMAAERLDISLEVPE